MTVWSFGSATQTKVCSASRTIAVPGSSTTGAGGYLSRPVTVAPRRSASGGFSSAIRTVWVRVIGIGLGRDFPNAAHRRNVRRAGQGHFDHRLLRRCPDTGFGDIEHGFPLLRLGDPHHHLADLDDLARIGTDGGHDPVPVRHQFGVADPVPGRLQGGLGGHHLGIRRALGQQCCIVEHLGGVPLGQELPLARFLVARLHLFRLGGGQISLGCSQGVALVLIVQPGKHVAGPDAIAHIDLPLDQLAGDAEAQVRFGPRLDRSGHGAGQAEDHGLDGDGPDGPDHRGRFGLGTLFSSQPCSARAMARSTAGSSRAPGFGICPHVMLRSPA